MNIAAIGLDEEEGKIGAFGNIQWASSQNVSELEEKERDLILKTAVQRHSIGTTLPHSSDKTLQGRASIGNPAHSPLENLIETELEPSLVRMEEIKTEIEQNPSQKSEGLDFPNLAWEAVKAGLAKEKITNDSLNREIKKIENSQAGIKLLLTVSSKLSQHEAGTPLSAEMKDLLKELKEKGIDLWKEDGAPLSKEKIAELNRLTKDQVDTLRSEIQIVFTTKIQVLIQTMSAFIDALKDILQSHKRLINTANTLPRH